MPTYIEPYLDPSSGDLADRRRIDPNRVRPVLIVDKDGNPSSAGGGGGGEVITEPKGHSSGNIGALALTGADSQTALSLDATRKGFTLTNNSVNTVLVSFSGVCTSSNFSFKLFPDDTYIDDGSWNGAVAVKSLAAGGSLMVTSIF
jgi:hypothetical protein